MGVEGITFTGGEPFQQSEALLLFCKEFNKSGMNIVSFSGYNFKKLLNSNIPSIIALLGIIDIIIAGSYKNKSKRINRSWNKNPDKKYIINHKILDFLISENVKNIEFNIHENLIGFTGFPDENDLDLMKEILNNDNLNIEK